MKIRSSAFACFVFAIFLGCSTTSAQQRFVANLNAFQVPAVSTSSGRALCTGILNSASTQINFACSYSGLGPAKIFSAHTNAAVGQTSPAVTTFPLLDNSPNFGFQLNLTAADLANLKANRWYLAIASQNFPNGEVRGQVKLANGTYNDHDGDGRTDIQVYRNSVNTFFALRSADQGFIAQQLGAAGDSVSLTVDFDGDGLSDFSTARYNAEVLWRIRKTTTGQVEETRWGSSTLGDFFASADYDGDGKFDIAVFRAGVWHIIESSTGNYRYEIWGTSGDAPAPNDYDGDGKADLTVARSEGGQRVWYTRFSSNGQTRVIPWGLSSDAFFTGRSDFDGDSLADLLVIRNVGGQRYFYILQSSTGALQIIPWGLSSDVVKLGDYDGDGRTDPAITRAVGGQRVFYILQSSNGQTRYETFGLAGDF